MARIGQKRKNHGIGPAGPMGPGVGNDTSSYVQPDPTYVRPQYRRQGQSSGIGGAGAPPPAAAPPPDPVSLLMQGADAAQREYEAAFNENLAKSRAAIDMQVKTALGGIAESEGRASAAVGQLPGMLQGIYGPAAQQIDQIGAQSKAAQTATGLQSFTGAAAGTEPQKAASTGEFASRQADVPLLQLGAQQAFAGQRAQVGSAQVRATGDLEEMAMQGRMDSMRGRADTFRQDATRLQDRSWAIEDAERQRQYDREDRDEAEREEKRKQRLAAREEAGPAPMDKTSGAYAEWLQHANPEKFKELQQSAPFRYATKTMTGKGIYEAGDFGTANLAGAVKSVVRPNVNDRNQSRGLYDPDTGYSPTRVERRRLTIKELAKKYRKNPVLVGMLRYYNDTRTR